ncbi:MAG: hypothetical protein WBI17_02525 [Clostridiaceae bacterium]
MENLAIIYIGGNTTRFALWQINEDKSYRLLQSYKETLKLGHAVREDSMISEDKVQELMTILSNYNDFANSLKVDITSVIFSEFFNKIENKEEIRNRIHSELGLDATELTSEEEVNLDFLAIEQSMRVDNNLIVDISGGSTQIAWVKDGNLFKTASLPMGTLTLTSRFHLEEMVTKDIHIELEAYLAEEIAKIGWLKEAYFNDMIIVGGSARAISKIDRIKRRYPMSIIHEYNMQDLDMHNMYMLFMTKSLKQRYAIEGLDKNRADIILSALAIFSSLLKSTGIQNLRVSGAGIREGFLFKHLMDKYGKMDDMLDRSISNILSIHSVDKTHAESLYKLTTSIYNALYPLHKAWDNLDKIIKVSSMLHDIGLSVRYYNHDRHNFYMISNSELNGLSHREIIMSSLAATFTDGLTKERAILQFGQIINRMDQSMINDIGICISMADRLLKSESKAVSLKEYHIEENTVKLIFRSKDPLHFELHEAKKLSSIFEDMYGKSLEIEIDFLQ